MPFSTAWSSRRGRRDGAECHASRARARGHLAAPAHPSRHRPACHHRTDGAALAAALALWLSGLLVGLRRREVAARLYALAALALALALCALVARDGGLFWVWPALAPATLAGLGALALAHRALAGSLSRT